jgi:hypothetical protein
VVINDYPFFGYEVPLAQERFTLAVNYLDEMPKKMQQALLSIENKMVFQTTPKDAEELLFYVGAMNPRQLTELAPGEAYGLGQADPPPSLKRLKAIRKRTRAVHTRPRRLVEKHIERYLS